MSRQYSPRHFLRQIPPSLLQRYFSSKNIELALDLLDESTSVDQIFSAMEMLPDGVRAMVQSEFLELHALACEGGLTALCDEASFHDDHEFVQHISEQEGFVAKVLWALLEKPSYFNPAKMFLHADNVSVSSWRKLTGLPVVKPEVGSTAVASLEKAISEIFKKEGRGRNCKVEVYHRQSREYFFAYPEDFAQLGVWWEKSNLTSKPHHPAFEIIFVCCPEKGSVDIYAPTKTKKIKDLQCVFAEHILGVSSLPDGRIDSRVYDLSVVERGDFCFAISPEADIESIELRSARLDVLAAGQVGRRLVLYASPKNGSGDLKKFQKELNFQPAHFISGPFFSSSGL